MRSTMTTLARIVALTALLAGVGVVPEAEADARQRSAIAWHGCRTGPADDIGAELDRAGAQCGDLAVPLDYSRPGGRTITVAMSRLLATDRAHRLGSLLLNTGGPGGAGLGDVLPLRDWLRDAGTRYDLIGMDPRFVGRSTALDCGWPGSTWVRAGGPDLASFRRTSASAADLARRCGAKQGDLLPYATTRNTARDMDAIRRALGEPKLSYLGYSYGTYLGAVYAQLFPGSVGRMVLDSAVDPHEYGPRLLRRTGAANEAALRDWAAWTATRHAEYGLGATGPAVLATVDRILTVSGRHPLRIGDFRVDSATVRYLLFDSLSDDRDEPSADLAATVRVLHQAARSGTAEPTPSLAESLAFVLTGVESTYGSVQAAIVCGDVPAPRQPSVYLDDIRAATAGEPHFAPLTRNLGPCAFWPVTPRERPPVIGNATPALIVQATGDPRTTYEGGLQLHAALAASRMVTLAGARIHAVFGNYGNACVDRQVIGFLRSGVLPTTDVRCGSTGMVGRPAVVN